MIDRHVENARTLASLLKLDPDEAAHLLDITLAITYSESDQRAKAVAETLKLLLERTVAAADANAATANPSLEIVIGAAAPRFISPLYVQISSTEIHLGKNVQPRVVWPEAPGIVLLLAAAYAAGLALRTALGNRLPVGGPSAEEGLRIPFEVVLGADTSWIHKEIHFTDTFLAGAGAIGNGFLFALRHFNVSGSLVVVDPDDVSDGNLNRCVLFTESDIGKPKARRLADIARPMFPNLELVPEVTTLQALGKQKESDDWLKRLIVGVDSRRTRRKLQGEIPGEVFDASTTGVVEGVFHHHVQPTETACLACIYHETSDELARERHIAEALGVELDDVKQHHVSSSAAERIQGRYPNIPRDRIEGQAYDSLFKALCSEGKLLTAENRQVLAPFACVSVIAGTYLAIEVVRRLALGTEAQNFNYWRFSPWAGPVQELRQLRRRNPKCEFCSETALLKTAQALWGKLPKASSVTKTS
jgi:molybdopterin/thiamine biosynthesis adenylyltransferase